VTGDRIVVVTGATGRQGGAVARHLLADGWRVRALTRRPERRRARELAALGAEVVGADMTDQEGLARALDGAYGVFSVQNPMISGTDGEIAQGRNVADAARRTGVRHVVYASAGTGATGTGIGSWESKLVVQRHLEDLGLPLTVLRPNAFLELMTDRGYFPAVSTWHLMPELMGADRPVYWLGVDDLGAIAARAFADPATFVGRDLKLAADVRSLAECRRIWREVTGRAPRSLPMPVWMFERFVGTDLTTMWRWLRTAEIDVDPAETLQILPTASGVREWLLQRRSVSGPGGRRGRR
jgi:uncharacterized protein YbjT (DUF2867 family)